MTQEEKARAYDDAIKKAESLYKASEPMSGCNVILETLFPELKESEDERIRKRIIHALHGDVLDMEETTKAISWLEKQGEKDILEDVILDGYILDGNEDGLIAETIRYKKEKQAEQNQTDKVKPKFKVGDWIINPRTGLIEHIKNVLLCSNSGNYEFESSSMSIDSVDNSFHLWTIQDAKNGDVLCCESGWTCIFNTLNSDNISYSSYCFMDNTGWFCETGSESHTLEKAFIKAYNGEIHPATKEQRDLLFYKMKEAGYEWDVEKRELKKINSYCQENCKGFQETGKCFVDGECKAKREAEQELTDLEEFINELSKQFPNVSFAKLSRIAVRVAKWAKSDQPKQEWSKEDDGVLLESISVLQNNGHWVLADKLKSLRPQKCLIPNEEEIEKAAQEWDSKANFNPFYMTMEGDKPTGVKQHITTHKESFKAGVNWILKSLKGRVQPQWKPSDKQMNVLWYHCSEGSILKSLYNDLKKLKES